MNKLNSAVEFSAEVVMYCPKPDQAYYFHSKCTFKFPVTVYTGKGVYFH